MASSNNGLAMDGNSSEAVNGSTFTTSGASNSGCLLIMGMQVLASTILLQRSTFQASQQSITTPPTLCTKLKLLFVALTVALLVLVMNPPLMHPPSSE
ncbi:glucan endo-1,3-beta-glucosidase 8-like [Sesbania bispinosa]|nr:glucan endo-1,3-beta-glucosidase 8-like [Sesbania bispinosa]